MEKKQWKLHNLRALLCFAHLNQTLVKMNWLPVAYGNVVLYKTLTSISFFSGEICGQDGVVSQEKHSFHFRDQRTSSFVNSKYTRHVNSSDAENVLVFCSAQTGSGAGRNGIPCPYCEVVLSSMGHVNQHLTTCHRDKGARFPFHCETCGKGFFSKSGLNHHAETHLVKSECFVCRRTFMYSRNLKRHLELNHGLRECRSCKEYINANNFDTHLQACSFQ